MNRWTGPRNKIFGVPLSKSVDKQADGTLAVRGYFTSDNKDEVGDIITRAATERAIPQFRRWGNIRYMHLPRPVGKMVRIGSEDGLEWNEVEIKVIDPEAVFMVENGLLTALSVGIMLSFDDVDMLEDGGLVINDYKLAEISLVDHPANYDAFLKQLPVDDNLRLLALTYGMDSLAHGMLSLLDKEKSMENEVIAQEEQVAGEPEAPVTPADETVVEEKAPEVEIPEQPAAEEKAKEPDLRTMVADLAAEMRSLAAVVSELVTSVKAMAEVREADGQAGGEQAAGEAPTTEKALVSEPVETADEPGEAVERKGAVPETTLPDAPVAEAVKAVQPYSGLRDALAKYFQAKK